MQPESPSTTNRQSVDAVGHNESPSKPQSPQSTSGNSTSPTKRATVEPEGNSERLLSPLARIRGRLHEKEERFKNLMKASTNSLRSSAVTTAPSSSSADTSSQSTATTATTSTTTTTVESPGVGVGVGVGGKDAEHMSSSKVQKLKNQLKNMAVALYDKEVETTSLRKELIKKRTTRQTEKRSLYPELEAQLVKTQVDLAKSNVLVQQQMSTIQELTAALAQQTTNSQLLQGELDERLHKLTSYEIDLETHDIHYTSYMREQQELEEAALDEVFDENQEKATTSIIANLETKHGCKVQELISKLLVDYADMEERYKRDRTERDSQLQELVAKNEELQSIVNVLGEQSYLYSHDNNRVFLQRISQLERTNAALKQSQETFKKRIEELEEQVVRNNTTRSTLTAAEGMEQAGGDQALDKSMSDDIQELRKRLKDQAKTIARLKSERSYKEDKIAALKMQAVNYQMKNHPLQYDSDDDEEHEQVKEDPSPDTKKMKELEEDIAMMKGILRQKDKEIMKERKRFAQREASLLARCKDVVPDPQKGGSNHHRKFFL